jgi:hypothetical protein
MKSLPIPLAALSLLLVPFVASLFTDEVQWSGLDYLIMGVMLLAVGSGIQWVLQKFQSRRNRLIGQSWPWECLERPSPEVDLVT